jgi:hypothetical protein
MVAGSWAREVYCNNLAMSVPDRSLELWPLAGNLLDECPNAIVEATEFWKEISARFDEPFYRENSPAELKAEFLVAQVAQMQFFERATKNLITLRQVLEQGRIANQTAVTLDETLKNASRTIALKVLSMPIEEHQALLKDFETLPTERRAILVNASDRRRDSALDFYSRCVRRISQQAYSRRECFRAVRHSSQGGWATFTWGSNSLHRFHRCSRRSIEEARGRGVAKFHDVYRSEGRPP